MCYSVEEGEVSLEQVKRLIRKALRLQHVAV